MSELAIYDSNGALLEGSDEQIFPKEKVSKFYYAGLRFAIDMSSSPTVIAYIQAKESPHARFDQYYAVYRSNSMNQLIREFRHAVETRIKDEYGWELNEMGDDVYVYNNISEADEDLPGNEIQHRIIKETLKKGTKLRLGVGSYSDAVSLFKKLYTGRMFSRGAIATDSNNSALDTFDVVIEKGTYRRLKPLGDSKRKIEEAKSKWEEEYLTENVREMKILANDIRTNTSYGDQEILREMERQMPLVTSQTGITSNISDKSEYLGGGVTMPKDIRKDLASLPGKILDFFFNLPTTRAFLFISAYVLASTLLRSSYIGFSFVPDPRAIIGFTTFINIVFSDIGTLARIPVLLFYMYLISVIFGNFSQAISWWRKE